jgi:small subunit ribosomal protein S17e
MLLFFWKVEKNILRASNLYFAHHMGKVRHANIKRVAKMLLENYSGKFTADYETNKKLVEELVNVSSKKLRNLLAGYITNLVRIQTKTSSVKSSQ